jgi:hypothetical protein
MADFHICPLGGYGKPPNKTGYGISSFDSSPSMVLILHVRFL